MSKRQNPDELDASFIISQAKSRNRPPYQNGEKTENPQPDELPEQITHDDQPVAAPKEDNRRRKGKSPDYDSLFIKESTANTRNGKAVYIRKEFHDRIMRIVQVIGNNELSLFSYVDNILKHHFETYQDEISELYNSRNRDIF